jgi:hypothetical protein
VYNTNSPISTAVAMDYAAKRSVPNVLSVTCADSATSSDHETIELSDFTSSIATPIEQFLTAHSGVNFVVLTKGIPIRINGAPTGCCQGNVDNQPNGSGQPSVDSYLAAIDYPQIADAKKIGITGSGTVGRHQHEPSPARSRREPRARRQGNGAGGRHGHCHV